MKKQALPVLLCALTLPQISQAQVSGSAGRSRGSYASTTDPTSQEADKRSPTLAETRDDGKSTFIDAAILMNVPADEYVAVFSVTEEGKTPQEATTKMEATIAGFKGALKALSVKDTDIFVDFIVQNRMYGFKLDGTIAQEELQGFELKKNVTIHFKDKLKVDQFVATAAKWKIYDLVKVDYIVNNAAAIQEKLEAQTMALIKQKAARYTTGLGVTLPSFSRVLVDKPSIYYPVQQYDTFQASEAENVDRGYNSNITLLRLRRSHTSFFNPLSPQDFDSVINPIIIEPVVQFTTYIKVQYGTSTPDPPKATKEE